MSSVHRHFFRFRQLEKRHSEMNEQDPRIKQDIICLIAQYLQDEGYLISKTVLQDEANIKIQEQFRELALVSRLRTTILEGQWEEVITLCKQVFSQFSGITLASQKGFMYSVHKQNYLEQVDRREYQQAFTALTKRIKPLESVAPAEEMADLCYLLTCKSVQDAKSFKSWERKEGRYKVTEHLETLITLQPPSPDAVRVSPRRLVGLLRQAVAYQIQCCPSASAPVVDTLLRDFRSPVVPNVLRRTMQDGVSGIKTLHLAASGSYLVTGSSDGSVRKWSAAEGTLLHTMHGHKGRVWQVSCGAQEEVCCSASADSTVKVWNLLSDQAAPLQTLRGHSHDVYAVHLQSRATHALTGGYDRTLRLFDIKTGQEIKTFTGHQLPVTGVAFNDLGNLALSGSKDGTVKLWDVTSGLSVKSFSLSAEVNSVDFSECGDQILVGARCNTVCLYDLRRGEVERRFRGHQNTSKHFVRARFGPTANIVSSGSEDGFVYMWDIKTGEIFQTLHGHESIVYDAVWSHAHSLLYSCSEDATVRVWGYEEPANPAEAISPVV